MKKLLMSVIAVSFTVSSALATEPYIKKIEKEIMQDGQKHVITEQSLIFENGKIQYNTFNEKGKSELKGLEKGKFTFGLEFGRPAGSNGGWSIWDFFNLYTQIDGKYVNIPYMYVAEKVYMAKLKDCTMVEFIWPLSADGSVGKMHMKVLQFSSYKDWLFVKVNFDSKTLTPWRITLNTYPGNSDSPKERERWIATKEESICLGKAGADFNPASNALAIFSKFKHENFGNFIVFDASKFGKITSTQSDGPVGIMLFPNEGETEFKFALGYFMDKPAKDEVPKFINETSPKIFEFMGTVNWDPKVDTSEFNGLSADVAKLIKEVNDEPQRKKYQESLDKIKDSFSKAESANNLPDSVNAANAMKELKEQVSKAGLAQLQ